MNPWKPIALLSLAALAFFFVAPRFASADGACHGKPNMATALRHLRDAHAALMRAERSKGAWRISALESTEKAMVLTGRACASPDDDE